MIGFWDSNPSQQREELSNSHPFQVLSPPNEAIDFGNLTSVHVHYVMFILKIAQSGGEPGIFLVFVYFISQAVP